MTFQRVLDTSGLTKIELAQLYDVSRQTLHYWRTVAPPRPGSHIARMAETVTAAILGAVNRGILPLGGGLSKEARRARVAKMSATLQNLKPAPRG